MEELGDQLHACHDCDLLQRLGPVPEGGTARCARCGAVLWRHKRNSLERTLAFAATALLLFVVANAFPFLTLRSGGQFQQTTLVTGVGELADQGFWLVAGVVFLTGIALPLVQILVTLYLLLPLRWQCTPPGFSRLFRVFDHVRTWSMVEVFLVGILVSLVKLADIAEVVPGIALWAFIGLIVALTSSVAALDARRIWELAEG